MDLPDEVRDFIRAVIREARSGWVTPDRRAPVERETSAVSDLKRHTRDLATQSGTHELDAAGETVWVESGGAAAVFVVLETTGGELDRIPAVSGLRIRRPYRRVFLVVPSSGVAGTLAIWTGRGEPPDVAGDPGSSSQVNLGRAELFTVSAPSPLSGVAIAGNVVSTLDGVVGYEYELVGLAVELDTDATVANRLPIVDVYDGDGTTIAHTLVYDLVAANQLGHLFAGYGGGGIQNLESSRFTMGLPTAQIVALSVGTSLLRATISAGVAGDAYKIRAIYRRRPG